MLLLLTTNTYNAYNDWGGSNHYQGFTGPDRNLFSPRLSIDRPFAKGFVTLPDDAPRPTLIEPPERMALPRGTRVEVTANLQDPDLLSEASTATPGAAPATARPSAMRLTLNVIPTRAKPTSH